MVEQDEQFVSMAGQLNNYRTYKQIAAIRFVFRLRRSIK